MSERATQMLLKYARNLEHNWQHLETDFFFQTNKVLFLTGVTSQSDSNVMIYHISDIKCWTHKSPLTYNLANIQNPVFNVTVGNHIVSAWSLVATPFPIFYCDYFEHKSCIEDKVSIFD